MPPHATVVLLVNWSGDDREQVVVHVAMKQIQGGLPPWQNVSLASGRPVTHTSGPAGPIFTLDVLIDGDAIILR